MTHCPTCDQPAARCWSCNAPMVRTQTGRWWCGTCETHRSDGKDGYTHWTPTTAETEDRRNWSAWVRIQNRTGEGGGRL